MKIARGTDYLKGTLRAVRTYAGRLRADNKAQDENKVCDRCGREIPDSAHRSMSDIDTYWCNDCEQAESESLDELEQRLADREALGVQPRPDNPVSETGRDQG